MESKPNAPKLLRNDEGKRNKANKCLVQVRPTGRSSHIVLLRALTLYDSIVNLKYAAFTSNSHAGLLTVFQQND